MTATYMKTADEQTAAMLAWFDELVTDTSVTHTQREHCVIALLDIYEVFQASKIDFIQVSVDERISVRESFVSVDIRVHRKHKMGFGRFANFDVRHYDYMHKLDVSERLNFSDIRSKAVMFAWFKFMTANFDMEMSPGMFNHLARLVHADRRGHAGGLLNAGSLLDFAAKAAEEFEIAGFKPGASSGIHECVTRGYGCIDSLGFWMFALPDAGEVQQPKLIDMVFDASGKVPHAVIDSFVQEASRPWFSFYKQHPRMGSVLELRTSANYSNVRRGGPDFRDGTFYGIYRPEGLFEILPGNIQGDLLSGCCLDFRYLEGDENNTDETSGNGV